jgi:hypothetical protein
MQARRSTRNSDRMGRVDCGRDKMLKAFDHWAEGESSRCKNISDKLALALADRRESEWDGITHEQSIRLPGRHLSETEEPTGRSDDPP